MQSPDAEPSPEKIIEVDYGPRILSKLAKVDRLMTPNVGLTLEERLDRINPLLDALVDDCLDLSEPVRTTFLTHIVALRDQLRAIKV